MGSKEIAKLGFREAWAIIGLKGKAKYTHEVRGSAKKTTKLESVIGYAKITTKKTVTVKGGSLIEVESAGFEGGNYSKILING